MTQELLRAAFEREEHQDDIVFADVAVDGARGTSSSGVLTYAVPARLANQLVVGQVVWVPIRRSLALGIIVTLGAPEPSFAVKDAHSVVEPPLRLDEERMEVASWLACETASGLYAAAAAFMPPGVAYQTIEYLRPRLPIESHLAASTPAQRRLLSLLAEQGEMSLDAARSALGTRLTSVVPALEAAGAIE
ncbi:MAG: hypothetical protein H0T49_09265, partial [Chloroflexia bacterium]|nr:hypothetical protein [Chloroflexia bacterium]